MKNFTKINSFKEITLNILSYTNLLLKDLTMVCFCSFIETNLFSLALNVSRQEGFKIDWFVESKPTTGYKIDLLEKFFKIKLKP